MTIPDLVTEISGIQYRADLLDREIVRVHGISQALTTELISLGHKQRSLRSAILSFIEALERYDRGLADRKDTPL